MAQRFTGKIALDVRDSVPDWAPYLAPRAPKGSPNVLIVAWDEGDITQVVLIEAKGVTAHSNTQVGSKLKKLRLLFGDDGLARPDVTPHFLLTSPSRPTKLATDHMPQWCKDDTGRLRWLHLDVPDNLVYPTRCDDSGKVTKVGGKWLLRFR